MKKKEPKIREVTFDLPAIAANEVTVNVGNDVQLLFYQSFKTVKAGTDFLIFLRGVGSLSLRPETAKELLQLLSKSLDLYELKYGVIKATPLPIQIKERIRESPTGRYEEE